MEFQKYIDKKIQIQNCLLLFIDDTKDIKANFQNLSRFLTNPKLIEDRQEFKENLFLISKIINNHHRTPDFFDKIEQIISIIKDPIKNTFSNLEIFKIFKKNKRILLYLIKEGLLTVTESIVSTLSSDIYAKANYLTYLYPEVEGLLDGEASKTYKEQYNAIIDSKGADAFNDMRQIGENESQLCKLIRDDSIEDFIQYVNQESIDLSSQIDPSLFETNPLLIKQSPSIIEYSTFFGSLKIIKYLASKGIELKPSLWIYAAHNRNEKLRHFLEKNKVNPNAQELMNETLKCHHFEITDYLLNSLLENTRKGDKDFFAISPKYLNFVYFPDDLRTPTAFYYLCKFDFVNIVKKILNDEDLNINSKTYFNRTPLQVAADEENFEIVQLLLNHKKTAQEAFKKAAFYECKSLKKVTIPSFITTIGESCFEGCQQLDEVTIPSAVTTIEDNAFKRCQSLTQVKIPSAVTTIGMYAFNQCTSLFQVTFEEPSSLTTIKSYAFGLCESIQNLTIPKTVTSIESNAFVGCTSLVDIALPPAITMMNDILQNCKALKKLIIPSSVTMINNNAFAGCSSLVDVVIPPSVRIIGNNAFSECTSLVSVEIPESVNEIGHFTFLGCISLEKVEIANSVREIGEKTFANCSALKSLAIPASVTKIGNSAFFKCASLETIEVPSSVVEIGSFAFSECTSLKSVVLHCSVKKIGDNCFLNCPALEKVSVPSSYDESNLGIDSKVSVIKI